MLQQAQRSGAGSELPFQAAAMSRTPARPRAAARKPAIIDADTSNESEEEVRPRACAVLMETLASRTRTTAM